MPSKCDDFESDRYSNLQKLETCLCAVLNSHEQMGYHLDEFELDINLEKWLKDWWEKHKQEDERLRQIAEEKRKRDELKQHALSKLTKEEIAALKYDIIPF